MTKLAWRAAPRKMPSMTGFDLEVTGYVDDVRPYVDRAAVFVCPLRKGAGIKNKVLQAWAMGKAVVATTPSPEATPPRWARDVSQQPKDWSAAPKAGQPYFEGPVPFVLPPVDAGEPFHKHNHQPSITWLRNGDLLAIWYSTAAENGTELTVLAGSPTRSTS